MSDLSKLIEKFKDVKVLVVGDVMLDRYFWGKVSRISPEAPVPIVNVEKTTSVLGGAANVAANIAGLGAKPFLFSICGIDIESEKFRDLLEKKQISFELIQFENRRTTTKTRIIAHHQHVARIDEETRQFISENETDAVLQKLLPLLEDFQVIVISDYAKGFLTENLLLRLITMCASSNKIILVDPKGKNFSKYKGASILTPNLKEAAEASGFDEIEKDLISKAGNKILHETELEAILITQGEKGMTLLQKNGEKHYLEAMTRNVFDVTGAGDTVIATFTVAVAAGVSFVESAKLANIAAGLVVREVGTTAIEIEKLKVELERISLTL
ncbi:MAG TPA: D-glycero-beta-D-manno-heptose-7-phosphate kinase [Pyrinomonadaceae bacterium]|nr:D-glycero-beta-D-manno-heptose-7-phosphate kinase [Pyrinomonadaceae bacterium]